MDLLCTSELGKLVETIGAGTIARSTEATSPGMSQVYSKKREVLGIFRAPRVEALDRLSRTPHWLKTSRAGFVAPGTSRQSMMR